MVATAGNQSFLGYRIDKGVPGMIQCALTLSTIVPE